MDTPGESSLILDETSALKVFGNPLLLQLISEKLQPRSRLAFACVSRDFRAAVDRRDLWEALHWRIAGGDERGRSWSYSEGERARCRQGQTGP